MLTDLNLRIRGLAPLIMHNGQLVNTRNPITRELGALTKKKGKTEANAELIARVEWVGGMYATAPISISISGAHLTIVSSGRPCVPGESIERMLLDAARTQRIGKLAQAGLFSDGNWPLEYDGPKDLATLADDDRFVDIRRVKVKQAAVMRCRPIFRDWSLSFTVTFNEEILNGKDIADLVAIAGRQVGLLEYRPKFGRFEVIP